jgi:hypothetical protein
MVRGVKRSKSNHIIARKRKGRRLVAGRQAEMKRFTDFLAKHLTAE